MGLHKLTAFFDGAEVPCYPLREGDIVREGEVGKNVGFFDGTEVPCYPLREGDIVREGGGAGSPELTGKR